MKIDMQTAPLIKDDFNSDACVVGTIEFLRKQVMKICRVGGDDDDDDDDADVDEGCFVVRAKVWLETDGKPAFAVQKALAAHPKRCKFIRSNAGGMHFEKQDWKSVHRIPRKVCLETMLEGHRDSTGKLDWLFLDSDDDS